MRPKSDVSTALRGLNVVDLSRLVPGAFCTLLLSDMGAQVTKVEEPHRGDPLRAEGPRVPGTTEGYAYALLNRNKRSITVNLKHHDGRGVLAKLLHEADILVESFRPGVMDRLGFAYSSIASTYPKLIYCSISGYGQSSPYAQWPGHDLNYLALAGVIGASGTPPRAPAIPISDFESGQRAALAVVAATVARAQTGEGQYIDISMVDGVFSWMVLPLADFWATGVPPLRMDEFQSRAQPGLVGLCPGYSIYRTADNKYLAVGASEHKFWVALCEALGRPDLLTSKLEHLKLEEELRNIFASRTQAQWMDKLGSTDSCVTPVHDVIDLMTDPHVTSHQLIGRQTVGDTGAYGLATALGHERRTDFLGSVSGLGEDTQSVLQHLGYTSEEIQGLRAKGAT